MKKIFAFVCTALLVVSGCSGKGNQEELKKVVVGASPTPHVEILKQIVPLMEEKGYELEIKSFSDYVVPNNAVENDEIQANYFQHLPYLEDFNREHGTHIVSVGAIHSEPMGIYADDPQGKTTISLDDVKEGSVVAVPNDVTNEARALKLLEKYGLITLEDKGFETTIHDITSNPKNISFKELTAETIPALLPDVDYAVINGNYALSNGISDKAIVTETKEDEGAKTYANILAVKEGNENLPEIQALLECLQSDTVKKYIEDTYKGAVIVAF